MPRRRGRALPREDVYTQVVVEPSEEVRAALTGLLGAVLRSVFARGAHGVLKPYFHDAVLCLHAAATDPSPDVKRGAMPLLVLLAREMPWATKLYAVALVRALRVALDHRHAKAMYLGRPGVVTPISPADGPRVRHFRQPQPEAQHARPGSPTAAAYQVSKFGWAE